MTHPMREDHARFTRDKIMRDDARNSKVEVVVDRHLEGVWANARKCWLSYDPDAVAHVVIQDDVLVCRDFISGVELVVDTLHEGAVFSLFSTALECASAKKRGENWFTRTVGLRGVALGMPTNLIEGWLEWTDRNVESWLKHDDCRLAMFCREMGIRVYLPVVSMVEHEGSIRSVARSPRLKHEVRAGEFVGEERGCLDFDWSCVREEVVHKKLVEPAIHETARIHKLGDKSKERV